MPIDRLLELYPIWVVLAAVGAWYCIKLSAKALNDFIELRRKKEEANLDNTIQVNRIKRLSLVEKHQKLQEDYDKLAATAKYHQGLNDSKDIEIAYLKPHADNEERMQEAFDLQSKQVEQQSAEITKLRAQIDTAKKASDATIKQLMLDLDICMGVIRAGEIGNGVTLIQLDDIEIDKDN